jgi:hypothetical protein
VLSHNACLTIGALFLMLLQKGFITFWGISFWSLALGRTEASLNKPLTIEQLLGQ